MKTPSRNKAFISHLTTFVTAAVACLAASTFAVVWQQQDNVRIAKENNALDNAIASLARLHTEIAKKIADENTFDALTRRNNAISLRPVREQQIVRVNLDPRIRLSINRGTELVGTPAPSAPVSGGGR